MINSSSIKRNTYQIPIKPSRIGTQTYLTVHEYKAKEDAKLVYIQASLHADEVPGLLVNHHLITLLDQAAANGLIQEHIKIISYANPIGLSQNILGAHLGRFHLDSGMNFNRDFPDLILPIINLLHTRNNLKKEDAVYNIKIIRDLIVETLDEYYITNTIDKSIKKELYRICSIADVVLDLHCDTNAVLHMYTHDRLWPQLSDLAAELQAYCTLLAPSAGGNPCDEACSCLWAGIADAFPNYAIPMACEAATVELRGAADVSDELASKDAQAIVRFLTSRGYLSPHSLSLSSSSLSSSSTSTSSDEGKRKSDVGSEGGGLSLPPSPPLLNDATPLTGVDMIESPIHGVVVWRVPVGSLVTAGQVIGEIIDIEVHDNTTTHTSLPRSTTPTCNTTTSRLPITSRTDGVLFNTCSSHLVFPGTVVAKVAGKAPLAWRIGQLLTAKARYSANTPPTSTTTSNAGGSHNPVSGLGQLSYDAHVQWIFAGPGYRAD